MTYGDRPVRGCAVASRCESSACARECPHELGNRTQGPDQGGDLFPKEPACLPPGAAVAGTGLLPLPFRAGRPVKERRAECAAPGWPLSPDHGELRRWGRSGVGKAAGRSIRPARWLAPFRAMIRSPIADWIAPLAFDLIPFSPIRSATLRSAPIPS